MTAAAHFAGIIKRCSTGTPLASVTDAAPAAGKAFGFKPGTGTFGYDANGNLSTDPYKGITTPITYNYLNLPQTINYGGGKSLTMVYDATGTKLRTTAAGPLPADNYIHDYAGGIEYRKGLLEAIYHEEGRVTPKSGGGWQYEYAIRDHLGNTRLTFADLNGDNKIDVTNTSSNEVLQENHYYPFGLAQNYSWMNAAGAEDVRYKFNGKELNEELGLYDYGARWYDGAIGRWGQVDPLADAYTNISPYAYVANNPIVLVDPDGASISVSLNGNVSATGKDAQDLFRRFQSSYGQGGGDNKKDSPEDMAILVAYPDDSPKIPSNQKLARRMEKWFGDGDGKMNGAGHAGIVIVDKETGNTRYFDFGRYNRPDVNGTRGTDEGAVRSSENYRALRIPSWDSSLSDDENVQKILTSLHSSPLLQKYGTIQGALATGLSYESMLEYAQATEKLGYVAFGGYTSGTACGNATYCAKFARGVGGAGGINFSNFGGFKGAGNVHDVSSQYNSTLHTIR